MLESRRVPAAGQYRLKVSLEGELSWESFYLDPRTAQRKLLSTLEGLRVSVCARGG